MNVYRQRFHTLGSTRGTDRRSYLSGQWPMNTGLIDANLGAGLFKKRIAMPGQGSVEVGECCSGFKQARKRFSFICFPRAAGTTLKTMR